VLTAADVPPPPPARHQQLPRQAGDDEENSSPTFPADELDPATECRDFLETIKEDSVPLLRFWRDGFVWWMGGRYVELKSSEIRAKLILCLNRCYSKLTTGIVGNVLDQLKAQALLDFSTDPPCWLATVPGCEGWNPRDVLAMQNGLIHLPSLAAGVRRVEPATPLFFSPVALDFRFSPNPSPPATWLKFLAELWPDDSASVEALQEWFGYCLTPDTRQQKILMLVGPRRCGKGTIARVLQAVIGQANIAGPTLASLGTNFGLQPLLGKTLAIISDARMSGRTDQAVVVERLLSISGEDSLTVDRKHMPAVTGKLLTRLMVLTNELPRLSDSSGALSGRMVILRLFQSFFGREDKDLTDKLLAELPGILWWAIEGWSRLRQRGRFVQPESGSELRLQMENIASPVGDFIRERCMEDPGFWVPSESLYGAWVRWCETKNYKPTSEPVFGRDLQAAVPSVIRGQKRREDGSRYYIYKGIELDVNSAPQTF